MNLSSSMHDTGDGDNNSNNNILSDKVTRALQVRTDTPAVKAALDALSFSLLDNKTTIVDSRSVRQAIETDALQQALRLQAQLNVLVTAVQHVRRGVAQTAALAAQVQAATHTNVVTTTQKSTVATNDGTTVEGSESADDEAAAAMMLPASNSTMEQEQALAAQLADAFAQRDQARTRLQQVQAFLDQFDLSPADAKLLSTYNFDIANDEGNGYAFLHALERVRDIRASLSFTFGVDSNEKGIMVVGHHNASAALRMMETLSHQQENAYERLYHWLQSYLQLHDHHHASATVTTTITTTTTTDAWGTQLDQALQHPLILRALYTLRDVPAFYAHLLELVATARRTEQTRRFLLALTSGYGHNTVPLELKAHDSVGYVADMLAYMFAAVVAEADVAQTVVMYQPDDDHNHQPAPAATSTTPATTAMENTETLSVRGFLAVSMSGVARPLKSRVLQVVAGLGRRRRDDEPDDELVSDDGVDLDENEGAVLRTRIGHLYDICGLLLYYRNAVDKALVKLSAGSSQDDNDITVALPILTCLDECLQQAVETYEATVRSYAAMLPQFANNADESAAELCLALLRVLADARAKSPGFAADVPCPATPLWAQTLALSFVADVCVSAALPHLRHLDDAAALRSAIDVARQAGMEHDVATRLEKSIVDRQSARVDELVETETTRVLYACGMGAVQAAFGRWQQQATTLADKDADNSTAGGDISNVMATAPGLSPAEVERAMRDFYASLYSPPIPSLEQHITDPAQRRLARSKIASNVCDLYAQLHAAILSGGYDDVTFLAHSPEQVGTLFSV